MVTIVGVTNGDTVVRILHKFTERLQACSMEFPLLESTVIKTLLKGPDHALNLSMGVMTTNRARLEGNSMLSVESELQISKVEFSVVEPCHGGAVLVNEEVLGESNLAN